MSSNNPSYNFLPAFIIGIIESLIVVLAIFCFLFAKGITIVDVYLYTSIAALFIAVLLGFGAYYTRKAELMNSKADSKIMKIYQALDIDENLKEAMVSDTLKENEVWEKEWQNGGNATSSLTAKTYGLSVFGGFMTGGLIILINNYLMELPDYKALFIPFILLGILGFTKYKYSNKNPFTGMLLISLSGILAAVGAYYAGTLFS